MAISGSQKAYKSARSNIARSGATRSGYLFPLFAVVTVGGVDVTKYILYGTLRIAQQVNDEPDTCTFDVRVTDPFVANTFVVGADVLIGLGGPNENAQFGGRILTAQTTWAQARSASVRSVMCADYLQVLDSENLITWEWPAQSATITIVDMIARFANRPTGVQMSTAQVQAGLPAHAAIAVVNENLRTVLRRLVTGFPNSGGFYVDPLRVLHVWQGASEPNTINPAPLTIDLSTLKAFSITTDGSQQRDAVIVEGMRTTAPLGSPSGSIVSIPVVDASIFDRLTVDTAREVRIGNQLFAFTKGEGAWTSPANAATSSFVTVPIDYIPDPGINNNQVDVTIQNTDFLINRTAGWIRVDDQLLRVLSVAFGTPSIVKVPRTGFGMMTGPIAGGATVTAVDSLGGLQTTGRYNRPTAETPRAQPINCDVVMLVRSTTAPAIHEHLVQDGRYSRTAATNRGAGEVIDFGHALVSLDWETNELNAKPGRLQSYSFDNVPPANLPATAGQVMILSTEITWPVWGDNPVIRCHGAIVETASITDMWITDQR